MSDRDAASPLAWYHAQLWCYGQWLPGDRRGFRSRDHKLHSSGDYKHRPAEGEHSRLYRYTRPRLSQAPVTLSEPQRPVIGELARRWFEIKSYRLIAIAVGGVHTHLLAELPTGEEDATIGKLKRYCSAQGSKVDPSIPSKLFAEGGEPIPMRHPQHMSEVYPYIIDKHAAEGAWVWGDESLLRAVLAGWGRG